MVSAISASAASSTAAARIVWLRKGSQGPEVKELQTKLKAAGFSPGPIDGDFGPVTEKAVRRYQAAKKLTVDGVVGPQTWASLNKTKPGTKPPTTKPPTTGGTTGVGNIPKTGNAFIDSIAAGAVVSERKTGVPAPVTIAQAILESGWGKSGLTKSARNLFGIKGSGPAGSVLVPTKEFINGQWITVKAAFRKYNSYAESMTDHGRLLSTSKYYTRAMAVKNDPKAFARALQGVYATDPRYASLLISLMDQYKLYQFNNR